MYTHTHAHTLYIEGLNILKFISLQFKLIIPLHELFRINM